MFQKIAFNQTISFALDITIYLMEIHYLQEGLNIIFLGEVELGQCTYLTGPKKITSIGNY